MTIDTLLVLKALAEETSGADGAGTAKDLGGPFGTIEVLVNVTVVDGDPPSALDLQFEVSPDNSKWFVAAKAPTISAPGAYRVAIDGAKAVDQGDPSTSALYLDAAGIEAARRAPRYVRKKSVVTAGVGGDGVTFSLHIV